jgi:rare lipoprotein A
MAEAMVRPRSNYLRRSLALVIALGGFLAGCTAMVPPPSRRIPPIVLIRPNTPARVSPQITNASWYGPGFNGRRTANGEIFRQGGMTAASKTLPLGSLVRVTNVINGRSVTVRINDRGPYVRGRSLDLSRGAAQRIGLTRQGVGRVKISQIDYVTGYDPP